ncbi:unnamed protein product [Moneuplotes crassus]|uniref:Uncharacterized protein n=1 Tax=Euplotes crassus TaxID=5936 RepID=A0AAD1Y274_EUPCR|nr:unnamed protein product [Moneuplotes crassus]
MYFAVKGKFSSNEYPLLHFPCIYVSWFISQLAVNQKSNLSKISMTDNFCID